MPNSALLNSQVIAPLRRLDVPLPDEVQRLGALWAASGDIDATPRLGGLVAALDAGGLADANVVEAIEEAALAEVVAKAAVSLRAALDPYVTSRVAAAVRDDGDRIVDALRGRFDEAAQAVVAASRHFGPKDSTDAILGKGSDASEAFHVMRPAVALLDDIRGLRVGLAEQVGYGAAAVPAALFVRPEEGLDFARLRVADRAYGDRTATGGRWLSLVAAGFRLRLNDASEAVALVDAAQAETDRRRAEAQRPTKRLPPVVLLPR